MTPSATPLLNRDSLLSLKQAGLRRLALSLDGPTPELHDSFRGVAGSFARTLDAMHWANEIGLPVQINTTVSRRNMNELEHILSVIRNFRIVMWSLFFMVPTGRAEAADLPSPEEFESAFARIYRLAQDVPFKVKTTEAQHYRRYMCSVREGTRKRCLPTERREYYPLMKARVSCSFRTQVKCSPADFFPFLPATSAMPVSRISIAIPNSSGSRFSLWRFHHGWLVGVGNVTIPVNHEIPGEGDLINVRYLYAFRGGSLYQPVYLGSREGEGLVQADNVATLKYKQDGVEDDS